MSERREVKLSDFTQEVLEAIQEIRELVQTQQKLIDTIYDRQEAFEREYLVRSKKP